MLGRMGKASLSRGARALAAVVFLLVIAAPFVLSANQISVWDILTKEEEVVEIKEKEPYVERIRPSAHLVAGDGSVPFIRFWVEDSDGQITHVGVPSGTKLELLEPRMDRPPPDSAQCTIRQDECFQRVRMLAKEHQGRVGFIQEWETRPARR